MAPNAKKARIEGPDGLSVNEMPAEILVPAQPATPIKDVSIASMDILPRRAQAELSLELKAGTKLTIDVLDGTPNTVQVKIKKPDGELDLRVRSTLGNSCLGIIRWSN